MPPGRPCTQADPCLLLLVEDSATTIQLFQYHLLEEPRFRLETATSLDEMREKVRANPEIAAVILDLGLDGSFGKGTLRGALEITRHRIPVVILTGGSELDEDEAREMGAYAFCEKTRIDQHALLKIVRGAIAHQQFIAYLLDQIEALNRLTNAPDESAGLKAAEELRQGLGEILRLLKPA